MGGGCQGLPHHTARTSARDIPRRLDAASCRRQTACQTLGENAMSTNKLPKDSTPRETQLRLEGFPDDDIAPRTGHRPSGHSPKERPMGASDMTVIENTSVIPKVTGGDHILE